MRNRQNKIELLIGLRLQRMIVVCLVSIIFCAGMFTGVSAQVEPVFLYTLSNFDGPIPYNWANIHFDKQRNEIYVVDRWEGDIRIFDQNGMEIYRFGDDGRLGSLIDVAVRTDGNNFVLSRQGLKPSVLLCDFRGEPLSALELRNFPPDFLGFSPDRIAYLKEQLYLLDTTSLRIAITDTNGLFRNGYDVVSLLGIEEKKRGEADIGGFSVDREGNMLFTIPVFFSAYILSPEGQIQAFGGPGSAPGGFGVIGDIVADERGYYYVADRLKCVVDIFDKDFQFQSEFGHRGSRPDNLIGPKNLVLDAEGRLYVSQLASRGVSVFKITHSPE